MMLLEENYPTVLLDSQSVVQTDDVGEITVNDLTYSINEDFRQQTIQIADEIDLDEIECASLFLAAQNDAEELDRSPVVSAILRYHRRRQYILECVRLIFQSGMDYDQQVDAVDEDDPVVQEEKAAQLRARDLLKEFTAKIINLGNNRSTSSGFWSRCTNAMSSVETGIQRVTDRTLRASVVGTSLSRDEEQIMNFERETLNTQHESLSAICTFMIEQGAVSATDFQRLLDRVKQLDRHDHVMIHYLPLLMRGAVQYTSFNMSGSDQELNALNRHILGFSETSWGLRPLLQAFMAWWIVEYKGRFPDAPDASTTEANLLAKSLKEGGLLFMLSVAQDVRRSDWHDPAKVGLTKFLLRDSAIMPPESPPFADYFQELLMVHFQLFVQGFIQNMPDTLRQLKFDEDDQRKFLRSRFQNSTEEYQYHLDAFLVIIAYAYQDSPESANEFWSTPDGNLYGFLQWAAKRQTTPRVAAFCEMLRSLSEGSNNADRAHNFLLEEGAPVAGKLRRTASLSWNQILAELTFYSANIKDRPALGPGDGQQGLEQIVEPESDIMLECYLRLVSHICCGSQTARNWILNIEEPSLPIILFQLCGSNTDSRLRGCAFGALASLLTEKSVEVSSGMWMMLDNWICGGRPPGHVRSAGSAPGSEQRIFDSILQGFEEPNAFMSFLNALVLPSLEDGALNDGVPFPELLGASNRISSGIDPYVDFAMGKIFAEKTASISDAHQLALLRLNCLDFICTCLSSFNEDLVIIANQSNLPVESTMQTSSLQNYLVLHPFARVMEWIFDDGCLNALFASAHQNVEQVNEKGPNSPMVLALVRAVEAMNLVMKLQSTYFDIVRPALADQKLNRKPVTPTPVGSFEEGFLRHLKTFVDLGLYCGLGHAQLTLVSLTLIERLASSKKLNSVASSRRSEKSRLVTVLEKDGEGERISRSMVQALVWDEWEYDVGPGASGYSIKSGILSFLKSSLSSYPERPTMAHLLLGFVCGPFEIDVEPDGLFAKAQSLFHAVARLALEYPDNDGQTFISWASNIKEACTEILRLLWTSSISGKIVLEELRVSDYLFHQAILQTPVAAITPWDGRTTSHPDFLITDSAIALRNFLRQRTAFYDIFARELRFAKANKIPSMISRLQATLLGSTTFAGSSPQPNQNIFELFDFMEIEFGAPLDMPTLEFFKDGDFAVCAADLADGKTYDLARAEEIVAVCRNSLTKSTPEALAKTEDAKARLNAFEDEAAIALYCLLSHNQYRELKVAQAQALKTWIRTLIVIVEACELDAEIQSAFFQQAFQLVLPKFEKAFAVNVEAAIDLAGLLNVLMTWSLTHSDLGVKGGQLVHGSNDVEFQVFRAVTSAIVSNSSTIELRAPCYQICCQYLRKQSRLGSKNLGSGNANKALRLVGERLVDVVCDDAYTSDIGHRISSLLVLEGLVSIPPSDEAKSVLSVLDRVNFIGVLVDSIKQIPSDLRHCQPSGTFFFLSDSLESL
jgi:nuclear pore complex protein Nup205